MKALVSKDKIKSNILSKQVDLLYGSHMLSIAVASTFVFLLGAQLITFLPWSELRGLCLFFLCIMLFRMTITLLYYSNKKSKMLNVKRAELLYFFGTAFTGIFWTVSILTLFELVGHDNQILLIIIILGFASASHSTMGFLNAPIVTYIFLLLVPLIFELYHSDYAAAKIISFGTFLYMLFMLRTSRNFYKVTYDMLYLQELSIDNSDDLLEKKEKANAANTAKSEFLSRMSHELRTPLNAILGLSELQLHDRDSQLTSKQSLRTSRINDAGKHLLSIVDDVLDFSRIETGSLDINIGVVNLQEAIQSSLKLVESKASLRNIAIKVEKDQSKVCVRADPKRLKQIIVNLLDNAIKYNKPNGMISLQVNSSVENRVRLYVKDTGYGLKSEEISELFVPFSRAGAEIEGIDGTGLGLSLCKELVELMNGRIGVDSEPDKGASFWVELPYAAYTKTALDSSAVENVDFKLESTLKILLVEDNFVNSEVAVDMLATIGFSADVAVNGEEALFLFETNAYSLILMDCEMPVMDGFTATEKIRQKEREKQLPALPILALTAHAISGTREQCIASGMDDFISKPFRLADLSRILRRWINLESTNSKALLAPPGEDYSDTLDTGINRCDTSILDRDALFKMHADKKTVNTKLVKKVVNIYLEQSADLLIGLSKASQTLDVEMVRRITHTLKSSSVNVGAIKFSGLCRVVELACEQGRIDDIAIQCVCDTYPSVEKALNDVLYNLN